MINLNKKLLIVPLIFTALLTTSVMTGFEIVKQLIQPDISIWGSHFLTIIFTTIVSVIVTFLALKKYYVLLKVLGGIIPICCNCKKIRDDIGSWIPVESYITEHSNAEFTHGICPVCIKKLYPGVKLDL
jgi:hypothetical protein